VDLLALGLIGHIHCGMTWHIVEDMHRAACMSAAHGVQTGRFRSPMAAVFRLQRPFWCLALKMCLLHVSSCASRVVCSTPGASLPGWDRRPPGVGGDVCDGWGLLLCHVSAPSNVSQREGSEEEDRGPRAGDRRFKHGDARPTTMTNMFRS
jgi:hypothetical protein